MNTVQFTYSIDSGRATLRPSIDGLDLLTDHRNDQGLEPDRLLPPLSALLLPTRAGHRVLIGCCSCGETGCGSLAVRLRRLGSTVLWEPDPRAPYESLSRTYTFDLVQYLDALDDASDVRPGEGRGSRVARRVRLALGLHDQSYDSLRLFGDTRVDWISAWPWDSDLVKVSLSRGRDQEVVEFGGQPGESDEELAARVAMSVNARRHGRAGDA